MGWEQINYNCGHGGEQQMYGPHKERARKAEWLGRGDCPDCAAKRRAEESAKAAESAQALGLPPLTGTPKQISWAETIRMNAIPEIEKALAKAATMIKAGQGDNPEAMRFLEIIASRKQEESAHAWIEGRENLTAQNIINAAISQIKREKSRI